MQALPHPVEDAVPGLGRLVPDDIADNPMDLYRSARVGESRIINLTDLTHFAEESVKTRIRELEDENKTLTAQVQSLRMQIAAFEGAKQTIAVAQKIEAILLEEDW